MAKKGPPKSVPLPPRLTGGDLPYSREVTPGDRTIKTSTGGTVDRSKLSYDPGTAEFDQWGRVIKRRRGGPILHDPYGGAKWEWPGPNETNPSEPPEPIPPPTFGEREITKNAKGDVFPVVYGTTKVGGRVVFYKTDITQMQLVVDIVVCEGPISAIRDIRFGDYTPEELGCVKGATSGASYNVYLGTANQPVDPLCQNFEPLYVSGKPGTAHVTFRFDGTKIEAQKVDIYSFKCVVDGLLVRDPRNDSSLVNRYFRKNNALATLDLLTDTRYGAGFPDAQFDWIASDPTHSWTDAANDCDYVLASQTGAPVTAPTCEQGSYGSGQIFTPFVTQYVYTYFKDGLESATSPASSQFTATGSYVACNVTVTTGPTGTTQRRIYRRKNMYSGWSDPADTAYYLCGVLYDNTSTVFADIGGNTLQSVSPNAVLPCRYQLGLYMGEQKSLEAWLEILRASYAANFNYDGKVHCWIDKARSDSGIVFDSSNIIGDIEISTSGLSNMYAKVKANFTNADGGYKDDDVAAEIPTLSQPPTEDEREERRVGSFDMSCVPTYDQAIRLCRQILNRSRLTRRISWTAMYRGLRIMAGMVVLISHPTGPLVNAKVIVTDVRLGADGTVAFSGEFYDVGVYSDTIQVNPAPIVSPPAPAVPPPPPTNCAVEEVIDIGPRDETISRLKVTFTPSASPYATVTRITVQKRSEVFRTIEAREGPIMVENPELGVEHELLVQAVGVDGRKSVAVILSITPVGVNAPEAVSGLAEDALRVLRVAASTARKYVWDFFLRVVWLPIVNADVKQYRVRWSDNPSFEWGDMTKELIIPVNQQDQVAARPTDIPGLKLWLRSDDLGSYENGETLISWADASGQDHTVNCLDWDRRGEVKTGAINGRPALRCYGTTAFYCAESLGIGSVTAWNYFIVFKPITVSVPSHMLYGIDRYPAGNPIASFGINTTGKYAFQRRYDDSSGLVTLDSTVAPVAGVPVLASVHRPAPGVANFILRVNGAEVLTGDSGAALTLPPPMIGNHADPTQGWGVNWDICEVLVYEGYLTTPSLTAIENYLKLKYALGTGSSDSGAPGANIIRADFSPFIEHDRTEQWEIGAGGGQDQLLSSADNYYAYNVMVRAEAYNGALGAIAQIVQQASTASTSAAVPAPYLPQSTLGVTLSNGLNSNITATAGYSALSGSGPTAAFSIGGFTEGAAGRWIMFLNTTSQPMTIVHESASSDAGNRINTLTAGDIVLGGNSMAMFYYNGTRWIHALGTDTLGSHTLRGINTQLFTSSSTWTAPPGVTKVYLTGCAGGGGGGGNPSSGLTVGGGGGAGDAVLRKEITVVPGTQYTITIGGGGNGGTQGNNGSTGTATSFGALLSLSPGAGGYVGSGSPPGGNGNGGASGGPGGSYGGKSTDTAGIFGGPGGGPIVGVPQGPHGTTYQSPFGAGGIGGAGSLAGTKGGDGFLYVEW